MEVIHARCAGIDVHKRQITVCARLASGSKVEVEVSSFGTTTRDLLSLSDWLRDRGISQVAMESTGSYWKPVYNILEGEFTLLLANAQHMKAVPGRKTDVKDAQWIAELHAHGLLRASFVPEREQRGLRELTRTRSTLVAERARLSNRIQKTLEDANVKLASVASDTLGVSGRAMLREMARGEEDPQALANLAKGLLRKKRDALELALEGRIQPYHRVVLGELLAQVESLDASVSRLDAAITEAMEETEAPFEAAVALIVTAPGAAEVSARAVLAEIGTDMGRFPSAHHLASWAGISPGNKQSGGKRLSTRILPGNRWLKSALVQMAYSAVRQTGTYLHTLYKRLAPRRGKKKAIVAVAHSLLVAIYHMLQNGTPYQDRGANHFEPADREKTIERLTLRIQKLGFQVHLQPAP